MNVIRVIGLIVLILGVLALVYGGFSYTKETHDAKLGPLEIELKDKERVDIPVWAGIVAAVVGGALVVFGRKVSPNAD